MARPDELTFAPLGGVGEIGMNLSIYGLGNRHQRSWLAVDLGVSFGDEEHLPGIDLVMPDMEGLELIRSLRRSHPVLPVIVISGGTRPGMEDYLPVAKLLGAAQILTKPFELPQLIDAVRTLVG